MASNLFMPLLSAQATSGCLIIDRSGKGLGNIVLAASLELAADSTARKRGLLGRSSLDPGAALAIAPTNGVHTFFMQFAIDIIFVTRDGRVVKIARSVKPWRIALTMKAFAVIELAAGTADRAGLAVGDQLKVLI